MVHLLCSELSNPFFDDESYEGNGKWPNTKAVKSLFICLFIYSLKTFVYPKRNIIFAIVKVSFMYR